jgi:chromosome segregation ATPase
MTTLEDVHKDVKKLTGAVEENGKQLGTQSTQITDLSGKVGNLTTSVGEIKDDLKDYRDDSLSVDRRLVAVETRVDERTQPGNQGATSSKSNSLAPIVKAKIKVLNAQAKIYIALAGLIGAGGTALISYLVMR